MKKNIRTNLKMLESNLSNFNKSALEFMDIEKVNTRLSEWRWFISHTFFKQDSPEPTGYNSKPPLGFLDSELQGLSVPLSRDIATCIEPVVQSGLKTEHAARRIMNRLEMLYGYVSPEDNLRSQQDHRDREDKTVKDRLRAQKVRGERKAERKEKHSLFIERKGPALGKKHQKEKKAQRTEEKSRRTKAKEATKKLAQTAAADMKKKMKERRI